MVRITYTLSEGTDNSVKLERQVEDVNASDNEKISSVKIINLFTDALEDAMVKGEVTKEKKNKKSKKEGK